MKYLALVLLAVVAVSANVRDVLRDQRQAILIQPQLQRPQLARLQVVAQPVLQQVLVRRPVFEPVQVQQPIFQTVQQQQPQWRIVSQVQETDPAGPYRWSFETENGIRVAEEGALSRGASSEQAIIKQGNFAYTSPDGTPISLSWVADENGFRASGAHLPTPPPIPEAILRSLEQNAREEAQGGFNKK